MTEDAIRDLYKALEIGLSENIRVYECWTRMPNYFSQELAANRTRIIDALKQWPTLHQKHQFVRGYCLICGVVKPGDPYR